MKFCAYLFVIVESIKLFVKGVQLRINLLEDSCIGFPDNGRLWSKQDDKVDIEK